MSKYNQSIINRRAFLKNMAFISGGLSCGLSSYPLFANTTNSESSEAFIDTSGYKALVSIILRGGCDSLNMLVPRNPSSYEDYKKLRSTVAFEEKQISEEQFLANTFTNESYIQQELYSFPKLLAPLNELYSNNKLAVVAGLGAMLGPVGKDSRVNRPRGLHAHGITAFWMGDDSYGLPIPRSGWAGRIADYIDLPKGSLRMNVGIESSHVWQAGKQTSAFTVDLTGAPSFTHISGKKSPQRQLLDSLNQTAMEQQNILQKGYADLLNATLEQSDNVRSKINNKDRKPIDEGNSELAKAVRALQATSGLGKKLAAVAQWIYMRDSVGLPRQTFTVTHGSYDTHRGQSLRLGSLWNDLSKAMVAFQNVIDLLELGVDEEVTTFTASEFGRTVTANGDGTDHGWGGHALVMGNSVKGGQVYGDIPTFSLKNPKYTHSGLLIPDTSPDQYGATLAHWFGVPDKNLNTIFTRLDDYKKEGEAIAVRNLGFMRV